MEAEQEMGKIQELRTALSEAVSEIEASPYKGEPWGWGITYRIAQWKALLRNTPLEPRPSYYCENCNRVIDGETAVIHKVCGQWADEVEGHEKNTSEKTIEELGGAFLDDVWIPAATMPEKVRKMTMAQAQDSLVELFFGEND